MLPPAVKNAAFLKLWIPQILTIVAQNALTYVIGIKIWQTTGSNTAVGTLLVVSAVPGVLFGSLAGAYVDRWDTKKTIVVTNLVRAFLITLFAFTLSNPFSVYPLIFLLSLATQFFVPAEASSIPRLVKKETLISANSLFALSFTLASAIGFLLSTPALRLLGVQGTILAAFLFFIVSTMINLTLPKIPGRSGGTGALGIFFELFNAAKLIITDKILRGGVSSLIIGNSLIMILAALVPGYAAKTLGVAAEDASLYVLAPVIAGIAAGTIYLNTVRKEETTISLPKYGLLVMGFCLVVASLLERYFLGEFNLLISTLVLFIMGIANSFTTVPATTIIHRHTPASFQGRIFGFINTFSSGLSLLPILLAGGLADVFGVPAAMQTLGLVIILFGFYRFRDLIYRK